MDREAWQAAVRGFTKMSHNSVTEHADRQTHTHIYMSCMFHKNTMMVKKYDFPNKF